MLKHFISQLSKKKLPDCRQFFITISWLTKCFSIYYHKLTRKHLSVCFIIYLQKRLKPQTNKIIANSVRVTELRKQRDSATPTAIQKRINPIILHIRFSRHTFLHYILCWDFLFMLVFFLTLIFPTGILFFFFVLFLSFYLLFLFFVRIFSCKFIDKIWYHI